MEEKTPPHLIIAVHGIRTHGEWQDTLEKLVEKSSNNTVFLKYRFGYFSLLGFIIPFFRWLQVRRFSKELRAAYLEHRPATIDLVGHSFGTYVIAWALRKLDRHDPQREIKIRNIIFAASALPPQFPCYELIGCRVQRIVNDCGTRDNVLLFAQLMVPLTGAAGRFGFVGMNGPNLINRYSRFGHGGYFTDEAGEKSDEYIKSYWLPVIVDDAAPVDLDQRDKGTIASGVAMTLANNLEPIKASIFVGLPCLGLMYFMYLASALEVRSNQALALAPIVRDYQHFEPEKGMSSSLDKLIFMLSEMPVGSFNILWVNDNPFHGRNIRAALVSAGVSFECAQTDQQVEHKLDAVGRNYDLIAADTYRIGQGKVNVVNMVKDLREIDESVPIILFEGALGRFSPVSNDVLREAGAIARVTSPYEMIYEIAELRKKKYDVGSLLKPWTLTNKPMVAIRDYVALLYRGRGIDECLPPNNN